MIIKDFDSFYSWLDANYENLSDKQYVDIVRSCISVYEYEKPKSKMVGLKRIKEFWNKYGHLEETPIFLDINNI